MQEHTPVVVPWAVLRSGLIFADAGAAEQRLESLRARRQELVDASDALIAAADEGEGRDLEDAEIEKIKANKAEISRLDDQIAVRAALVPQGQGRKTGAEPKDKSGAGTQKLNPGTVRDSGKHNFTNFGEALLAARAHARGNMEAEGVKKLLAAATTYGNEGTGADGGFLVPPDFAETIWKKVTEADENLMDRCAQLTPSGNSMSIPKDETSPWGTSGIRVYWDGEANSLTPTKPVFENSQFKLVKLTALAPVTDETLEDARGFESWLNAKVPQLIAQAVNTGIVSGNGVGKPYGILQAVLSGSGLSVAKETSQPAATVWFANINKMWSRMYAPWRRNAVWLINQDIEPSLHGMAFQATGASSMLPGTSAVPAYLPLNGLSGSPYATLMGRPVIPIQACSTVGTQGDIILVDLNQYWILKKASGMRTDTSMHFYFDQSITAFRFILRINGQPAWSAAISPQNGSNTLSWACVLDNR